MDERLTTMSFKPVHAHRVCVAVELSLQINFRRVLIVSLPDHQRRASSLERYGEDEETLITFY